jgi:hypothetical protein
MTLALVPIVGLLWKDGYVHQQQQLSQLKFKKKARVRPLATEME